MANAAAKKRLQENAARIALLLKIILIANGVYFPLRFIWFYSSFSNWHVMGFILTSVLYLLGYKWINDLAKPSYDSNGKLVDAGADLNQGFCQYYFDILFITAAVQILTALISDYFWFLYLAVPAYAGYKLWQLSREGLGLNLPGFGGGNQGQMGGESRAERRKRESKEKKDAKKAK